MSSTQFDSELINNKNILFISNLKLSGTQLKVLLADNKQNMFIICDHLEKVWTNFKNKLKVIHAAGGLVLNKSQELLFIFRNKKWDLPKGKREKNEKIKACAKREVMEECGLNSLKIKNFICDSYHIYTLNNKPVLKITTWYLMQVESIQKLIPQIEEGITKLNFFSRKKYSLSIRKKTYPLIGNLVDNLPNTIY